MSKILILLLMAYPVFLKAQLSTTQKKEVNTLIANAVNPLVAKNVLQDTAIAQLQRSVKSLQAQSATLQKQVDSLTRFAVIPDSVMFLVTGNLLQIKNWANINSPVSVAAIMTRVAALEATISNINTATKP